MWPCQIQVIPAWAADRKWTCFHQFCDLVCSLIYSFELAYVVKLVQGWWSLNRQFCALWNWWHIWLLPFSFIKYCRSPDPHLTNRTQGRSPHNSPVRAHNGGVRWAESSEVMIIRGLIIPLSYDWCSCTQHSASMWPRLLTWASSCLGQPGSWPLSDTNQLQWLLWWVSHSLRADRERGGQRERWKKRKQKWGAKELEVGVKDNIPNAWK